MIVVTGGLGFIGNELVRQLKEGGEQVHILDNYNRVAENIEDLIDIPITKVDITDKIAVDAIFDKLKPKIVFHLAAIHFIPECNASPEKTLRINVEGTQVLLAASIRCGCKHFLFASTGAVYKDSPAALDELYPIGPVDIYGLSKWFAEDLCRWNAKEIPVTICRLFNNMGLRETNAHIIPEIISQLKTGTRTLTLGNISPQRDYISTKDTAYALIQLSKQIPTTFEVYNVATGIGYSVKELIDMLADILGFDILVEKDPSRFRKADKEIQIANIDKLKSTLQWEPKNSVKDVLNEIVDFEKLRNTSSI
jgi:UDP-glucose 4-epimerase